MIKKYHLFLENQIVEQELKAGKNIFKSFLKVITALGLKSSNPNWENTPDDFLIYYLYKDIDCALLKSILLHRFKSLNLFSDKIEYIHNSCNLYFGIKNNMIFEYGFITDKTLPIGEFKLNKSILNWILLLDSPSIASLKRELIIFDVSKLQLLGQIKTEVKKFNPGNTEKRSNPIIKDDVITFGYYGLSGRWNGSSMDKENL